MIEPAWIEIDDLIEFNRLAVEDTGEPFQIRDLGSLEMSANSPRDRAHYDHEDDVIVLGCTLAISLAQNHCFAQGNKRTAQAALFRFLWINDYTFIDPNDLELAELLYAVVKHEISSEEYIDAIDRHVIDR